VAAFASVALAAPALPVFSNVTGAPHGTLQELKATLMRQITAPVLWERSVRAMVASGVTEFVEPGPGAVLSGLVGKIDASVRARNLQKPEDVERVAAEGGKS
jgi:[acyl-carrier-protein] S-malonyltransferase